MATDVYSQLYFHIVWTTRERLPLPDPRMQTWLCDAIMADSTKRKARTLAAYVIPDHVHLLVSLPPIDLSHFVGRVKGASARAFNVEWGQRHLLKWQDGYGILSLREKDTEPVIEYIQNQEQIHANPQPNSIMEITEVSIVPHPRESQGD